MAGKQIRVSRRMLFIWFMLAGFIFLLTPHGLTRTFQDAFNRIFSWPLSIGRSFTLSARTEQPLTEVVAGKKYRQLETHLANIMAQRDQAYEEIEELSGLRKRLPLEGAKLARAGVIRESVSGRSELIINRGRDDGLADGQFVLADNSIIGTIFDVSPRTAHVRLFTDPTSSMIVNVPGLENKLLMRGNGDDSARIEIVKSKIKVGEAVLVHAKPGFLDEPMIIGRVSQCERNKQSALVWDLTVKPICDVEEVDNVTVIVLNAAE